MLIGLARLVVPSNFSILDDGLINTLQMCKALTDMSAVFPDFHEETVLYLGI